MNKILWLSRHDMSGEQCIDLLRIFPDSEITKVDKTIGNAAELAALCSGYDVLAAVLPLDIMCELMATKPDNLRVIFAKSGRLPTGGFVTNPGTGTKDPEYKFVHTGWFEVKRLDSEICKL